MHNSFVHNLLGFRFINLCGILIGLIVWNMTSDLRPLSSFLFGWKVYTIAAMIAITFHIVVWLLVYNGALFDVWRQFKQTLEDCVIINLVVVSFLSCLFLMSFLLL